MHIEKEDIEKLFSRKFSSFEIKTTKEEWAILSSKLRKLNFLRFTVTSFNIYYLTIIIALAGSATFTAIHTTRLNKKIHELENQAESLSNRKMNSKPETQTFVVARKQKKSILKKNILTNREDTVSDSPSIFFMKGNVYKDLIVEPVKSTDSAENRMGSVPNLPADSITEMRKYKKRNLSKVPVNRF